MADLLMPWSVYKFACNHCNTMQVGETVRHIATGVDVHPYSDNTPSTFKMPVLDKE